MAETRRGGPSSRLRAALIRWLLRPAISDLLIAAGRRVPGLRRLSLRLEYWGLRAARSRSVGHGWNVGVPIGSSNAVPVVFLFHTLPWVGGNWEYTRQLVETLADMSEKSGRFRLTVLLHSEQADVDELRQRAPGATIVVGSPVRIRQRAASGAVEWRQSFDDSAMEHAARADVWVSLSDRFAFPLAATRPYAVVVHDVIQRHLPESFGPAFHVWRDRGMRPTLSGAGLVIVSSQATLDDAAAEYAVERERIVVVPVACQPELRFGRIHPRPPAALRDKSLPSFLLHVGNASSHKGHELLFRGYALLREQLGARTPALVVCGGDTLAFAARKRGPDHPHWRAMRRLIAELRLVEGRDLHLLGSINDDELVWLYNHCELVLNAARFDNGTYCLVEANYFSKPFVSSEYPAATELARRFGLAGYWFSPTDAHGLATQSARALSRDKTSTSFCPSIDGKSPEFTLQASGARLLEAVLRLAKLASAVS